MRINVERDDRLKQFELNRKALINSLIESKANGERTKFWAETGDNETTKTLEYLMDTLTLLLGKVKNL